MLSLTGAFKESPLTQLLFGCRCGTGRESKKDGDSLLHVMCAQVDQDHSFPTFIQLLVVHCGNRACNRGTALWLLVPRGTSAALAHVLCPPCHHSYWQVLVITELCGISHLEPPVLTWPRFSAISAIQARTPSSLPRDGLLLWSACHFCSFDKIAFFFKKKKSTFPVIDEILSYFFFEQTKYLTTEI